MFDARRSGNWAHTSEILAMLANVNRDPKKRAPFSASDFNPCRKPLNRKPVSKKEAFSILKAVFVDKERSRT